MTDDEREIAVLIEELENAPPGSNNVNRIRLRYEILKFGNAAVPYLIQLLDDPDLSMRLDAVLMLSEQPDVRAIPALLTVLRRQGEFEDIPVYAREALEQIGEPAVPGLINLLWEDQTHDAIAESLANIGMPALPALLQMLTIPAGTRGASAALARFTDIRAVPFIRPLLNHPVGKVRGDSAWALVSMGDSGAIPILLDMLVNDPDEWARLAMAQALMQHMREGDAVPPELLQALQDENALVREYTLSALARTHDDFALPTLLGVLLNDPTENVRSGAAIALKETLDRGDVIPPELWQALKDESDSVRVHVLGIFQKIRDASIIPDLIEFLKGAESWVRYHMVVTMSLLMIRQPRFLWRF